MRAAAGIFEKDILLSLFVLKSQGQGSTASGFKGSWCSLSFPQTTCIILTFESSVSHQDHVCVVRTAITFWVWASGYEFRLNEESIGCSSRSGIPNIFPTGPDSKYFRPCGFGHNHSTMPLQHKSTCQQYLNEQAWLCPIKLYLWQQNLNFKYFYVSWNSLRVWMLFPIM